MYVPICSTREIPGIFSFLAVYLNLNASYFSLLMAATSQNWQVRAGRPIRENMSHHLQQELLRESDICDTDEGHFSLTSLTKPNIKGWCIPVTDIFWEAHVVENECLLSKVNPVSKGGFNSSYRPQPLEATGSNFEGTE